ncbi:hypothetical protein ASG90_11535 [Nocardioides sp. Soil797]|nr:hypothetical protein ASG90_11535 [Nocardioides sp. Soil797]
MAALVALMVVLVLASCSGDDRGDEKAPESGPDATGTTVTMKSSAGKVTGKLKAKVRKRVVARVAQRVDRWFDAAWLDADLPRTRIRHAWPGFTKGLAARARKDKADTTNVRLAPRIDGVAPVRKRVKVDILAVKGRAVGSTARFLLVFDTSGDVERRVRVRGQLSLSPGGSGWKVFGYDVRRSVGAVPDATHSSGKRTSKQKGTKPEKTKRKDKK